MGKIVMSDNVSLDGVVQDPAGDDGFRVGGWVGMIAARPELAKLTLDEALGSDMRPCRSIPVPAFRAARLGPKPDRWV
jgi:hypothetical protein